MANRLNNQANTQLLTGKRIQVTQRRHTRHSGANHTQMRAQACPDEDPGQRPLVELMPLYLYLMGADGDIIHGQSLDAQAAAKR